MKKSIFIVAINLLFLLTATTYAVEDVTVFNETFIRGTGSPVTETRTFPGVSGTATIKLINGSLEDSEVERVSSSLVTVNGQSVFSPSDFNQNIYSLGKEIALSEGQNFLSIRLKSKPGASLHVQIIQQMDGENFALDFSDCPVDTCAAYFSTAGFDSSLFEGRPLTFEAWVKPKSTSTATILHRMTSARGVALTYVSASTTEVTPQFQIRRTVHQPSGIHPTSTVKYNVSAASNILTNVWSHVAGILSNSNHSATHAPCTDATGAQSDPWHIDVYINGIYSDCAKTFGGTTASGYADPTVSTEAYAHEPIHHTSGPGILFGIIDEARIWNTEKTVSTCMNQELSIGGVCDITSSNLITYHSFNEGSGYYVYDLSGLLGIGIKEYPDYNTPGQFLYWTTGWTTDTPF